MKPSTRIGPYEVIAPIGSGGTGEVFRARDTIALRSQGGQRRIIQP